MSTNFRYPGLTIALALSVLAQPFFRAAWRVVGKHFQDPVLRGLAENIGQTAICGLVASIYVLWIHYRPRLPEKPGDMHETDLRNAYVQAQPPWLFPLVVALLWPMVFYCVLFAVRAAALEAPGIRVFSKKILGVCPFGLTMQVIGVILVGVYFWGFRRKQTYEYIRNCRAQFREGVPYCACGYSLRGGASDRCPECGRRIEGGDGGENA